MANKFELYDLARQYDVFEPWLNENGITKEDLPVTAKTDFGTTVIVDAEECLDGTVWKITTPQGNGWNRIHYYHKDGTVEELYER